MRPRADKSSFDDMERDSSEVIGNRSSHERLVNDDGQRNVGVFVLKSIKLEWQIPAGV
jgi:hypothetical protein